MFAHSLGENMSIIDTDQLTSAHSEFALESNIRTPGPVTDRTIAIVGLGYVGLPTALSFAHSGHEVIGLDASEERLARIRAGEVDLTPDDKGRLAAASRRAEFRLTSVDSAVAEADAVIVCVPTPIDVHQLPDLSILRTACERVVSNARPGQLIVLTSTTYAGTTYALLVGPLAERGLVVGTDINVAFSPERINPGDTTHTHDEVPRVVGGVTDACAARAAGVLGRITSNVHVVSTTAAAELTKLYENTFRAVNISLANEFATVCGELGVDVSEVIEAAATKPFGFMRFDPGPGVGGHCIPCDPHYLLWQLREHRMRMPLVEAAMHGIENRPLQVCDRVLRLLADQGIAPRDARVLVVGVAYKPDVEDVRESPAIEIVTRLVRAGVVLAAADPHVRSMRLTDGTALICSRLADLDVREFDVVIVHTLHRAEDLTCLEAAPVVLDATYRLPDLPGRVIL